MDVLQKAFPPSPLNVGKSLPVYVQFVPRCLLEYRGFHISAQCNCRKFPRSEYVEDPNRESLNGLPIGGNLLPVQNDRRNLPEIVL